LLPFIIKASYVVMKKVDPLFSFPLVQKYLDPPEQKSLKYSDLLEIFVSPSKFYFKAVKRGPKISAEKIDLPCPSLDLCIEIFVHTSRL